MSTRYRTGRHWGLTIVRESTTDTGTVADQLVAVVTNGDRALAERLCVLLNADEALPGVPPGPCPATYDIGLSESRPRRCELLAGHAGDHKDGGTRWFEIPIDQLPFTPDWQPLGGVAPDPGMTRPLRTWMERP